MSKRPPTVLIVEDSKFFASMLRNRIEDELGFSVEWKATFGEAAATIDCCKDSYLVALLDVTLPDAPNGEVVDYALMAGIPSIVFTGGLDSKKRNQFLDWHLVDYILKDSQRSVETLLGAIDRIHRNQDIKVLVVDDSRTMRETICKLLRTQLYQVFEADNGQEALEVLTEHPDIMLVITDYDMPRMDGFELISTLRETRSKNELAIIGISASNDPLLSARLIKSGANDFVPKPFHVEEFHCRVGHSIEMLENIALIRDLSYRDPLTRLVNRRYFFENADKYIENGNKAGKATCVAMLDIDHFKHVNDTYGHDGGDAVLKAISDMIARCFTDSAIVSRFGGEEFCVLYAHDPQEDPVSIINGLRQSVETVTVPHEDTFISVTISAGVCCEPGPLDTMLKLADSRLYTAKESGRNRVVGAPDSPNVRT